MSFSLDASIRTCKVETGQATRIESDRFLNPTNMICLPWNGLNNKGQSVCVDSWYTKSAGCNSAEDRVEVENALRPIYSDYINLNVQAGLGGDIYQGNQSAFVASGKANQNWQNVYNNTPSFGNQWQSVDRQICGIGAYERGMAQMSNDQRKEQYMNNGYFANARNTYAGR